MTRKFPKRGNIRAEAIMSDVVVVVDQNMNIGQVAHLLLRQRVSGFPVVDKKKKVVGIVTITDLLRIIDTYKGKSKNKIQEKIAPWKNMKIKSIMSRNLVSIAPGTTLDQVIRLIIKKKIHTFPVMENQKLVGILGRHDVLNAAFSY